MPIITVGATGRFSVSRLRRRLAGPTLAQKFMGPAQSGNAAAPRGACVAGAGANGTRYELHKVPAWGKKLFSGPHPIKILQLCEAGMEGGGMHGVGNEAPCMLVGGDLAGICVGDAVSV